MNKTFREYYPFSDEAKTVLDDSVIILDTNVLLNLYRYNSKSREKMFEILTAANDRLYMPYWVANEFMQEKRKVILEKVDFSKALSELVDKKCNELKNGFTSKSSIITYLKNEKKLKQQLEDKILEMNQALNEIINGYESDFSKDFLTKKDPVLDRLTILFSGKIGPTLTKESIKELSSEAADRYEDEIPPGYKDAGKTTNKYGDFIIWHEILEYCKSNNKNLLFVSDDQKEDWCEKEGKNTLGPRYELKREFYDATNNCSMHFLSSKLFVQRVGMHYGIEDIDGLSDEIEIITSIPAEKDVVSIDLDKMAEDIAEAEKTFTKMNTGMYDKLDLEVLYDIELERLTAMKEKADIYSDFLMISVDPEFQSLYFATLDNLESRIDLLILKHKRLYLDIIAEKYDESNISNYRVSEGVSS